MNINTYIKNLIKDRELLSDDDYLDRIIDTSKRYTLKIDDEIGMKGTSITGIENIEIKDVKRFYKCDNLQSAKDKIKALKSIGILSDLISEDLRFKERYVMPRITIDEFKPNW